VPYSTQFAAINAAEGTTLAYTVPASYIAVIREIDVYGNVSGDVEFAVEAEVPGPLTVAIYYDGALAPGSFVQWKGRAVLNAGDLLNVVTSAGTPWVLISGYLLSAP
jgi:hypothetical protein